MKKNDIALFIIMTLFPMMLLGQSLPENQFSLKMGFGTSEEFELTRSFEMDVERHLFLGLYITFKYSKVNGTTDYSEILGANPKPSGLELGEYIRIDNTDGEALKGSYLSIKSYQVGFVKHIQMSDKSYFSGSLCGLYSNIYIQSLAGIEFDQNGEILNDQLYPVFEKFGKIGVSIDLLYHYFLGHHLSMDVGGRFLSQPQLAESKIGFTAWF